jgi:hypothetical protein
MGEVSMQQKSFWDRLRGKRLRERVGTLGGHGLRVIGVTPPSEAMARWLCLEHEFFSVISSDSAGAWETLILDLMIRRCMCVD